MSLQDHPRAYGVAALTVAFAAGVLVTLGAKDLYPDLERRFEDSLADNQRHRALRRRRSKRRVSSSGGGGRSWLPWSNTTASRTTGGGRPRDSEVGVVLEDHESAEGSAGSIGGSDVDSDADSDDDWSLLAASEHLGARGCGVADGIAGCIGDTPLVRIASLSAATGCDILAKAELLNPGGSPKDRVALAVIRAGEARGLLAPHRGDTIYEGTVGSTGISIATLARALGYRAHICMPDDQSHEKSQLLREMGAIVERVPVAPIVDPGHYVNLARRRAAEHAAVHSDGSRGFFSDQFETPANAEAHRRTTGPEILRQVTTYVRSQSRLHGHHLHNHNHNHHHHQQPRIAAFVCGAGTAGTLTGVARFLKEDNATATAGLRVVAADPQGSGLFNLVRNGVLYASTEKEGTRRRTQVDSMVEGIGMNRMTATLEAGLHLIDDAVSVTDTQACLMARWLVEHDGIFAGSSTAVNCVAAVATALTLPPGSRVVTILCDTGLRHLSKFYKAIDAMSKSEEAAAAAAAAADTEKTLAQPETVKHRDDLLGLLGLQPRTAA